MRRAILGCGVWVCALGTSAVAQQWRAPAPWALDELGAPVMKGAPPLPEGVMAFEDDMPAVFCFDEGSNIDPAIMASVTRAIEGYRARYQLSTNQWGTDGNPTTVTWSFVPDGLFIDADASVGDVGAGSTLFASMDAKFGGIANRATWIAQFQAAFDRWEQISGLNYTRLTPGGLNWDDGADWNTSIGDANTGQIRIAMRNIDGGSSILAYNYFPTSPENALAGNMVVDVSENWGSVTNTYRFLRNTLMHEMGHGLGLRHVCPSNGSKLMEPFINTSYDGPRHDDFRGVHDRYGDQFENNDTSATANFVGTTSTGVTLSPSTVPGAAVPNGSLMSLDDDGDIDWYRSSVTAPRIGTITVTPVGLTYDNSTQNANGTCNSGNNFNSLAHSNFQFEVYGADATTIWATGSGAAAGLPESVTNVLLSPPGNYFVRVIDTSVPTQSQLYTITFRGDTTPTLDASDGDFSNRVRLIWTPLPGATEYSIFRNTVNNRATATFQIALASSITQHDVTTAAGIVVGTTYYWWVEAVQGGGGRRPLAGPDTGFAEIAPSNNACASAITMATNVTYSGDNSGASNDGSTSCGFMTDKDVWYTFTAPCTGQVRVTTCGTHDLFGQDTGMDTVVSVHSACVGTTANQIACNDDAAGGVCTGSDAGLIRDSSVTFNAVAGSIYKIRLSGYNGSFGEFRIRATYLPPANDNCPSFIGVTEGTSSFGTCGATTDGPNEPLVCNFFGQTQVGQDIWYGYTAACTGEATIDLCGSLYDTKVAVYNYNGACPTPNQPGTAIACDDDASCGLTSLVTFSSIAGNRYLIRVGGFSTAFGSGTMTISCPICGDADFDNDGDSGTDADIEAFFACLGGGCCAACDSADFDGDGDVGTDNDIESFFTVLGGGDCV